MTAASPRPVRSRTSCLAAAGAATLIAAGATLGLTAPAMAAGNDPGTAGTPAVAPVGSGWIRAGHLLDGVPRADVRLTPASGGSAMTLKHVTYGDLTDYRNVPTGLYTASVLPVGATSASAALLSTTVRIADGEAATMLVAGSESKPHATLVEDDLTPPPAGQAKVRLISGVSGTLDAQAISGPQLADNLKTGSTTDYADVAAKTWTVRLTSAVSDVSINTLVPMRAGGVYTMVALGTPGNPRLDAFRDQASTPATTTPTKTIPTQKTPTQKTSGQAAPPQKTPGQTVPPQTTPPQTAPTGGVETGGGWLARQGAGQDSQAAALRGVGLAFAAAFGGVLFAVRRRGVAPS